MTISAYEIFPERNIEGVIVQDQKGFITFTADGDAPHQSLKVPTIALDMVQLDMDTNILTYDGTPYLLVLDETGCKKQPRKTVLAEGRKIWTLKTKWLKSE